MYQIDEPTAPAAMPAPPAAAAQGWFQEADAASGTPPVSIRAWWLNMVQAELGNVLVAAGLVRSKSSQSQLAASVQTLGTRSMRIANAGDPANNVPWIVPAGVTRVACRGRGPGGPGGYGSTGSNGVTSGGASAGGGYFDVYVPVQPGDTLLMSVGAALQVGSSQSATPNSTILSKNGVAMVVATGAQAGGNASGNTLGVSGASGGAAITAAGLAAGVTGETYSGGGATYGIYLTSTSGMSIAGSAWSTTNGAVTTGGNVPGQAAGAPGGGGCGGVGLLANNSAGQPGGAGADGDGRIRY